MLKYESTGRDKKMLAQRIAALTGGQAYYTKAPLYAYVIGGFVVDGGGNLLLMEADCGDRKIIDILVKEGYISAKCQKGSRQNAEKQADCGGYQTLQTFRPAGTQEQETSRRRTAAYIRVSTDSSDQENSYAVQEHYFRALLAGNPEWIFAGIYFDYGISGTDREKRTGFTRLLRHCEEGRIDRVVCKSISRFARNTYDFIKALRILQEHQVTVFFEKENLDTAESVSDFILTALGAVAQEESRSISANVRWSMQKRFPRGDVRNHELYGYRYSGKTVTTGSGYRYKAVEIVEEEAQVVIRIYQAAAEGKSFADIARSLNRDGIPAPLSAYTKKRKSCPVRGQLYSQFDEGWTARQIAQMVRRERYAGNVLIQKTYTPDYLTHKTVKNRGELDQFLVTGHHPAIISRDLYEEVQEIIQEKQNQDEETGYPGGAHLFSGRLICAACGRYYHVRNTRKRPIWFCPSAALNNGLLICRSEKLYEDQLVRMLRQAVAERYHLPECSEGFLTMIEKQLEELQRMDFAERDRGFLQRRIAALQVCGSAARTRIEHLKKQKADLETRKYVLGEPGISRSSITALIERIFAEAEKLKSDETEEQRLLCRRQELEDYWELLEADFREREQALLWIRGLPAGDAGVTAFLDGMAGGYIRAFVLSVTVHTPAHYTVHWFDNVRTEVRTYDTGSPQRKPFRERTIRPQKER